MVGLKTGTGLKLSSVAKDQHSYWNKKKSHHDGRTFMPCTYFKQPKLLKSPHFDNQNFCQSRSPQFVSSMIEANIFLIKHLYLLVKPTCSLKYFPKSKSPYYTIPPVQSSETAIRTISVLQSERKAEVLPKSLESQTAHCPKYPDTCHAQWGSGQREPTKHWNQNQTSPHPMGPQI